MKYSGEFSNNHPDGAGIMKYPDGRVYSGQFRDNKREGNGTM